MIAKMNIVARPYRDTVEDAYEVCRMHAEMGFDYDLPDLAATVSCLIEVDGVARTACFLRPTVETYFLSDGTGTRRDQLGRLLIVDRELRAAAKRRGFEDAHCWIPPEIEPEFGRLLLHLGWERPLWPSYSRRIG